MTTPPPRPFGFASSVFNTQAPLGALLLAQCALPPGVRLWPSAGRGCAAAQLPAIPIPLFPFIASALRTNHTQALGIT
jgi:hypothetical protein